tara:strand:+ start:2430 stop:3926 length:1497 start_codon:yes stop_codon:yes gene_type:complete
MIFEEKDHKLFAEKGITEERVKEQIEYFKSGFPFIKLNRPCIPQDGIIQLETSEIERLLEVYEAEAAETDFLKFVPASGAASRMFKHLFSYKNGDENALAESFIQGIEKFAFYNELKEALSKGGFELNQLITQKDYETIFSYVLESEKGLGYGQLPKGLIDFHLYPNGPRKAVVEHFVEGVGYAKGGDEVVRLHFTVSVDHKEKFETYLKPLIINLKERFGVGFEIEYSFQSPSTDTIAVDMENAPFRLDNGTVLFRPGGHGALINNLNDLDADVIFIKNIDNIVPERLQEETIRYKKVLCSKLLELKAQRDYYLRLLQNGNVDQETQETIAEFAIHQLKLDVKGNPSAVELYGLLNRPMRICGMVKNEGEPGGGPFWVEDKAGNLSMQIVEKSQIDIDNPEQADILSQSTHFNPVDLICATKNHMGEPYDLVKFRDPETGFISHKSLQGRELKALELPGLWNGAMAHWITLFVEVPLITFNPVKTVNDLLKPNHQPG